MESSQDFGRDLYNLQGFSHNSSVYSSLLRGLSPIHYHRQNHLLTLSETLILKCKSHLNEPEAALSRITAHYVFGDIKICQRGQRPVVGKERRYLTALSKNIYDIRGKKRSNSKYYLFLEGIYYKEDKLSFKSIFSGTPYFPSNISS